VVASTGSAATIPRVLIADLASTALGAGIAITAGVVAAFVQFWLRRKERAEERSAERQDRAASAVGPTLSLLRSLDPQPTVAVRAGTARAREVMDRHWSRWDEAQDTLEIVGAGHPSPTVREACDSIIDKTGTLLNRLHVTIILQPNEPRSEQWWEEVQALHRDALEQARGLVQTIREAGH
jgi:hypothetical protein